jgi:hypothetical protein
VDAATQDQELLATARRIDPTKQTYSLHPFGTLSFHQMQAVPSAARESISMRMRLEAEYSSTTLARHGRSTLVLIGQGSLIFIFTTPEWKKFAQNMKDVPHHHHCLIEGIGKHSRF